MIIPTSVVKSLRFGGGHQLPKAWHWRPGLPDLRLQPLPWYFVCSDSVYYPPNPVR